MGILAARSVEFELLAANLDRQFVNLPPVVASSARQIMDFDPLGAKLAALSGKLAARGAKLMVPNADLRDRFAKFGTLSDYLESLAGDLETLTPGFGALPASSNGLPYGAATKLVTGAQHWALQMTTSPAALPLAM